MKNKFYHVFLALVLCIGAFFVPVEVHAQGGPETEEADIPPASASMDPEAETVREPVPFTPDGQASVVDHASGADGKEFYTFSTPEGNVFYLVIDNQRDSDNVYFLNAVTEEDLLALAEDSREAEDIGESAIPEIRTCTCTEQCPEGWADISCSVCRENPGDCRGKAPQAQMPGEPEEKEPAKETGSGNGSTFLFILLAAAAVGGAGYYLKVYKPKHDLDDAEDLDELLDDGQEVNEDEADGNGSVQQSAWNREEQEESAAGAETVLYDDYPEDDYPDSSQDDMQEE